MRNESMRFLLRILFTTYVLFSLTGCTLIPEQIDLQPQIESLSPAKKVGQGKPVAVKVVNLLPKNSIGGRPSAGGPAAKISISNNMEQVVENTIYPVLEKYGFKPIPCYDENAPRKLTLRVVSLMYRQKAGANIKVTCSIEVHAENKGKKYEKVYQSSSVRSLFMWIPTTYEDTQEVNKVLSNTLTKIAGDEGLIYFLAR